MIGRTNASGGGGGLNFVIVGGTTRPANAAQNMVWVNTSREITGYVLSAVEPETPSEGMLWVQIANSSPVKVGIPLGKDWITLCLSSVAQYIGGAWVAKDAMIYTNGEWMPFELWLISNGQTTYTINAIGKQWASGHAAMSGQTVTQKGEAIEITGNTGTGMAYITGIDLTAFKELTISGTFKLYSNQTNLVVWSDVGTYITDNIVKSVSLTETGATLDVSELSGTYVVGISMAGTYTQTITNFVLT